jgi:hypothetical protein
VPAKASAILLSSLNSKWVAFYSKYKGFTYDALMAPKARYSDAPLAVLNQVVNQSVFGQILS